MSAKPKDLTRQRSRVRKLMPEQSEFPIETPPTKYRQQDFPLGSMLSKDKKRDRLTKKIVPLTAGAQ